MLQRCVKGIPVYSVVLCINSNTQGKNNFVRINPLSLHNSNFPTRFGTSIHWRSCLLMNQTKQTFFMETND